MAIKKKKTFKVNYVVIPAIVLICAAVGSYLSGLGLPWYATLAKPSVTPPGFVFSVAWFLIYISTAYSAFVIWNRVNRDMHFTVIVWQYGVSIFFYFAYIYLFSIQNSLALSILVSALFALNVIVQSAITWPVSKRAAVALLPLGAWLVFATYLVYALWQLNEFQPLVG